MNYINVILKDKSFLKKTFALTIPVTLQNLLNNLLNLIDVMIIGQLGDTSVAAVGLANKVFFVFSLLMFGVCSGSAVLASQYYGKRELLNIKRVLRMSLLIGITGSFFFLIPGVFFPKLVMRIFTPKQEMIEIGAAYLVVIAVSYPITAITNSLTSILRSMNYVKLPVIITTFAIGINVVLNFGFVFGKFGLPEIGVAGSALATVIARIIELSLLLLVIFSNKPGDDGIGDFLHAKYDKKENDGKPFVSASFVQKYLHTASPVIANEFMWGLGVTMYSMVYGRMGDTAVAAITMTNAVEQIVMVVLFGISNASAVILGNELGANQLDKAKDHAKSYLFLQFTFAVTAALLTFLLRDRIVSILPASESAGAYIRLCITVLTFYMPVKALNILIIVAILRSGGDTKAALFLDVSGVWGIGIPMAVLGGLVFHFPIYIVYGMVMIEEVYKTILGYIRYRQNKWIKNIVSEIG